MLSLSKRAPQRSAAGCLAVASWNLDPCHLPGEDIDLEKISDRLALAVHKQWAYEAKRREITSSPLAVSG